MAVSSMSFLCNLPIFQSFFCLLSPQGITAEKKTSLSAKQGTMSAVELWAKDTIPSFTPKS